jgi:phosphotransferase system  glucose/maltose/N-acetylglucosamine-specific IIC component
MRRGFGLIGLLVTIIFVVIVGTIAYNIGWSDGVNTHLPAGTAAAPYYYGPHYGDGFGLFGIFWFLLILFGIFWLFRLAFWGFAGRKMMGGGWGCGRGWGYGQGGPRSFEERAQEWHRKQHGEQPPSGTTPPPPPDTRSV